MGKVAFLSPARPIYAAFTDEENFSTSESDSGFPISPSHRMNAVGSYGNKSSPNRLPDARKKRITRDTLDGRLRKRKGKPGSRKYNRWENEKRLGRREEELSDTGPLEDEFERYLFDANCQNIFYQMFEDPDLLEAWQPFLDIEDDGNERLLHFAMSSDDEHEDDPLYRHDRFSRAHIAFARLTSEGRRSIVKYAYTEFLEQLDLVLYEFIQGDQRFNSGDFSEHFDFQYCYTTNSLRLSMKDSFHRLMVHSISTFYDAMSVSETTVCGEKIVVVTPPARLRNTPRERLVDYLRVEFTNAEEINRQNSEKISRPPRRCRARFLTIDSFSNEQDVGWF